MGRARVAASTASISAGFASRFMRSTQRMTWTRWAFQPASLAVGASAIRCWMSGRAPNLQVWYKASDVAKVHGPAATGTARGWKFGPCEAEAAGFVAVVDAHGLLPREWRARARGTRSGAANFAPHGRWSCEMRGQGVSCRSWPVRPTTSRPSRTSCARRAWGTMARAKSSSPPPWTCTGTSWPPTSLVN